MPFPIVLGLFKHWAEEPPIAMSLAATAGFKKKSKGLTDAEQRMVDENPAKVISIDKLPPSFQHFIHDVRSMNQKKGDKKRA